MICQSIECWNIIYAKTCIVTCTFTTSETLRSDGGVGNPILNKQVVPFRCNHRITEKQTVNITNPLNLEKNTSFPKTQEICAFYKPNKKCNTCLTKSLSAIS
jgi:hypothetical protein